MNGQRDILTSHTMDAGSRILVIGGLFLVLAGLSAGEIFALFLSHAINADLRLAWENVLAHAGQEKSTVIAQRFEEIQALATERARAMSVHSHIGAYGILAASLGIARIFFTQPRPFDPLGGWFIIAGGLLQSAGFLTLDYQSGGWLSLSNVGAIALLAGLLILAPGLLKGCPAEKIGNSAAQAEGWILRLGASLVLGGLLFGMYLAWRNVFFNEPMLHQTLSDLIKSLAIGDRDTATGLYKSYKMQQITMAITAAAHSHAIAFGFVMIIAAFLAKHVRLTSGWLRAAYWLIAAGGLLLPLFVYLAPRYGYVFALCADTAGGLVIIGLLIVVVGLFRQRGMKK